MFLNSNQKKEKQASDYYGLIWLILYICFILGLFILGSCNAPQGVTSYQNKNLQTFHSKKQYKKAKKPGSWYHPAVTKESRKMLKSQK